MRAVRSAEGAVSIVDVAPPEGDGVRIRVASVGICGSDLHLVSWNLPSTLGHEMAGFLPDGTAVAVEPMAPCGSCPECLSGAYNLCTLGPSMLIGTGRDGGMADECLVPPSAIVPLAGGVPVGDACLVEPLAVAVHGIRRGQIGSGDRVAVVGGGSIGQLSLAAAQAVGATVDLEARHDHQRAVADELGAGEVTDRYDVVVESAGTESAPPPQRGAVPARWPGRAPRHLLGHRVAAGSADRDDRNRSDSGEHVLRGPVRCEMSMWRRSSWRIARNWLGSSSPTGSLSTGRARPSRRPGTAPAVR